MSSVNTVEEGAIVEDGTAVDESTIVEDGLGASMQ